jgi:hypothetical protein
MSKKRDALKKIVVCKALFSPKRFCLRSVLADQVLKLNAGWQEICAQEHITSKQCRIFCLAGDRTSKKSDERKDTGCVVLPPYWLVFAEDYFGLAI